MNKRKIPKSIWLPSLLAIYFIGMAVFFGPELIRNGEVTRLIVVSIVEIIIILAIHLFYKHREKRS